MGYMKPIRILLADDHNLLRDGLRLLLERQEGFAVVAEASDGREAVRLDRDIASVCSVMTFSAWPAAELRAAV